MYSLKATRTVLPWATALILAAGATAATAAPVPFPGGRIDGDRLEQGEIYLGTPKAAVAPAGCKIVEKYVVLNNTHQFDKIGDLFTPDGVFLQPSGVPAVGRAAINQFYTGKIKSLDVRVVPVSYAAAPGLCFVQLVVARLGSDKPTYFSASIDQFILAPNGQVRMMMPYGRGTAVAKATVDILRQKGGE